MRHGHRLPVGATLLDPGRALFRLWAPAQGQVVLELEDAAIPMRGIGNGWFEITAACAAGARYRYRLGDGQRVPDPASRFQPDDVHGPSMVVDASAYDWEHGQWRGRPWTDAVIYELHVGACGGFAGVQAQLPRLQGLGVTAVELMPIADFPGARNWGYDGVLPFAPDASYGAPADLKRLVDAAHGLGLMVFLDVVYNHFGPDGNYLHAYAPQFFRDDLQTPWGVAIDFRRREVRQFFVENALYWLMEYRFDGLRLDAVHAIHSPDFLDELAAQVRARVEPGREVHLVLENERNEAKYLGNGKRGIEDGEKPSPPRPHSPSPIPHPPYDAQWNDDAHNALHVLLTGEQEGYYLNYAQAPAEKLARCLAEGFAYQGEPSPSHGGARRGTPSAHVAPERFVAFLQNHDQVGNRALGERLVALADEDALRAALAVLLLCPQVPLLFMGEEWGCRRPFLFFTDFHGELAAAVREGRRREFEKFSAFADVAQRARIPDPNDEQTFRDSIPDFAASERGDWPAYYRHLLELRHAQVIPRLRGTRSLGASAVGRAGVSAAWRLGDGAVLRLAANFAQQPARLDAVPGPLSGSLLFETGSGAARAAQTGTLPGRSACALLEAPA